MASFSFGTKPERYERVLCFQIFLFFSLHRTKMQRDQQEHEEIVQGLTTSIMDETKRAQKAEVPI